MRSRQIAGLIVVVLIIVLFAGGFITWLMGLRADANRQAVLNNLRQLGQFAAQFHLAQRDPEKKATIVVVPSGTVFRPELPPEQRLSWVPAMLPLMDQRRQNTEPILQQLNPAMPWDGGSNRTASLEPIRILLCPALPPEVPQGEPAVTQIVGIGGLGADAATLPINSPRAGAFRYDSPTPLAGFPDGTSHTLLFGETNYQLGPWIRGGPSTVRGFLDEPHLLGVDGQFGGIHGKGTHFGMADGRAQFLLNSINPQVLRALATRAGGAEESEAVAD